VFNFQGLYFEIYRKEFLTSLRAQTSDPCQSSS